MKCFSVAIAQRADGTARLAFVGGDGRTYYVDNVEAGRVVWLASTLLEWSLQGLLFDEDGSMSPETMRDLRTVAAMCHGGE